MYFSSSRDFTYGAKCNHLSSNLTISGRSTCLNVIRMDSELGGLKMIQVPLLDVELKGAPALRFLSDSVWK
jgi:hypothetical protein